MLATILLNNMTFDFIYPSLLATFPVFSRFIQNKKY